MKARYLLIVPIGVLSVLVTATALWALSAWIFGNQCPLDVFLWGSFDMRSSEISSMGFVMGRFISLAVGGMIVGINYEPIFDWLDTLGKPHA